MAQAAVRELVPRTQRVRAPACGVLDSIGDTPLVELSRLGGGLGVRVWAKLEAANPGGSAKDRPAARMISDALRDGSITRGTTIVESTSGNMGVGLAQACRYHGIELICVVDPRATDRSVRTLRALGAQVEMVDTPDPATGDLLVARRNRVAELLEQIPNSFSPDQYTNWANPAAHAAGTMREIDEALEGEIDHVFVATSTAGMLLGCCDYLRDRRRRTRVVAVDALGSVLFGGAPGVRRLPGLGAGVETDLSRCARLRRAGAGVRSGVCDRLSPCGCSGGDPARRLRWRRGDGPRQAGRPDGTGCPLRADLPGWRSRLPDHGLRRRLGGSGTRMQHGRVGDAGVTDQIRVAIVGLGPKGLFALERLLHHLRDEPAVIDVYEPYRFPGAGPNYALDQPGYLRMNFTAAFVDAWPPGSGVVPGSERRSFVEWAACDRNWYPPRAEVGRYLTDVLRLLLRHVPTHHPTQPASHAGHEHHATRAGLAAGGSRVRRGAGGNRPPARFRLPG